MLSDIDATARIKQAFPDSRIELPVEYRGLYLFQVLTNDPLESGQDPFFSVNKQTGEIRDFSVITDGDPKEIEKLFIDPMRR